MISSLGKKGRESEIRNNQIVADVEDCIANKRTPLVLTKFKEHAANLYEKLNGKADHIFLLQGGKSAKERDSIRKQMKEVPENETIILVAIGQYITRMLYSSKCDNAIGCYFHISKDYICCMLVEFIIKA